MHAEVTIGAALDLFMRPDHGGFRQRLNLGSLFGVWLDV
jgi:hypothetical protein